MPLLLPDLVYHDGAFRRNHALDFDRDTGRILHVAPAAELLPTATQLERLPARALLPGFANAHSHAFQRLIRGRTQWAPPGADRSDFWSWREEMYGAANRLSPDDVFTISRFCFLEMLRAGFTSVGEFHYLHRDPAGREYDNPNELAQRVIAAAEDVGIRLSLLNVCYAGGGIDQPLGEAQRRFATPDLERFMTRTITLAEAVRHRSRVEVGMAAHSLRAVPRDWLPQLGGWARRHDTPLHVHVAEQTAEVDACVEHYGLRPVELLAEDGLLDERLTAVHATHLTDAEVELLARSGAVVCACPTTERDLGDGFLRARDLWGAGGRIAIGTDSHTSIDPFEEMRLIEYHERLLRRKRNVIAREQGDRLEAAPPLLDMATHDGARALGLDVGRLAPGMLADLVAIDLTHPVIAGWTDETLAASLVFSATPAVVTDVWVGGVRRLDDRHHALDGVAAITFREAARRLPG